MKRLIKITRGRGLIILLGLYLIGLGVGYIRLPWAAIKNLDTFGSIANAPAVTISNAEVSFGQLWYLKHALNESPVTVEPSVSVWVSWNALILARVRSGAYIAPLAAGGRDTLYFCLFGAWVPLHTYEQRTA